MKAHWMSEDGALEKEIAVDRLRAEGVVYQRLETDPDRYQDPLAELMEARGYVEQDQVELSPDTPKLDEICAKFVDEHFHDDDEVRFVLEGEGIFDIRSEDDRWMHVVVEKGDLIVVPAKRHHRFMLTDAGTIRCVRLFRDPSGWVPHYRADARADA